MSRRVSTTATVPYESKALTAAIVDRESKQGTGMSCCVSAIAT